MKRSLTAIVVTAAAALTATLATGCGCDSYSKYEVRALKSMDGTMTFKDGPFFETRVLGTATKHHDGIHDWGRGPWFYF